MSTNRKEYLFAAWVEQSLTEQEREEFETLCLNDETFRARVESINVISEIASSGTSVQPPAWDKSATFTAPAKTPWFQWSGLPAASMACSVLAIVMVLSGFSIEYSDQRLSVGFGGGMSKHDVDQLVAQKVTELQAQNNDMFAQYLSALQDQQMSANAQLTEYLLTSNRQERREDFAELIQLVNQQRYDDQVFYARQLNSLQREISIKTGVDIDAVTPANNILLDE